MESPLISLKTYLEKGKPFRIPYYQRGYVWGKSRDSQKNSVQFLMESIVNCFKNNTDLFLQGVTVSESTTEIELIDGQQRTTAFYLLLQYLGFQGDFTIDYPIRIQSQHFLDSLKIMSTDEILNNCLENTEEQYQDIYYFKKSMRIIHENLKDEDKETLIKFLINDEKVKFLYINIQKERATTIFKMMNGNKAEMKAEEVIKAEMLRLVSNRGINEFGVDPKALEALRWNENLTRSKYAREWDKWLYWWNKEDVKKFYHTSNVMGLLVETFFYSTPTKLVFNYENFRDNFLRGGDNTLLTKEAFYKLRQLQKKFEDVFNSFDELDAEKRLHNKVGAIQTLFSSDDRKKFIQSYFAKENSTDIDEFLKLVYLGLNFSQIENVFKKTDTSTADLIQIKKDELLSVIENDNLYPEHKNQAFIQLLRLNVEEDNKLGRKFDFSIWNEKSLEHIYPKSKVYRMEDGILKNGANKEISHSDINDTFLNQEDFAGIGSEHCIGNLVLLYGNENSSFGAKDFNDKKAYYFDFTPTKPFRSRHLLHTISVFAQEKWKAKDIQINKKKMITEIKTYYGIL
ncbi:DUF262 domain-containing protein [Flavobacterium antarcticum]|uniref:DUF262 domain-containing protein n=1 Tax=Flavobacterium antarcticum TaxID=271155 RepID=UPI0003B5A444|nr:DUF262 domain-containing protein [Flavobacterium antarcticum]